MFYKIGNSWDELLKEEFEKDYFKKLEEFIKKEYTTKVVYPKYNEIFNALRYTPYEKIKVVILGQDPYHGIGEAHGLSFSVPEGIKKPPSLINIFKELNSDLGIKIHENGTLISWAKEGVLLLNAILTVRRDEPLSHKDCGWEIFTDEIIKIINKKKEPVVFILWGSFARSKKALITNTHHLILE
ncbi:MAG TPA: uracil-DNA glycosylase, partial [Tenericutes bacterium]|nr:uracil-DNA glycosylase [Mycoplasmatota bacterium]